MTVGIMQPYFLPYLGYFQLMRAVDRFVILDDVNYIVKGYINRNSILLNGNGYRFTVPLEKPSRNKLINETKISSNVEWKDNFLKTIKMAYLKASEFKHVFSLIERMVAYNGNDLTCFLHNSLVSIKEYLGLKTEILISSQIPKDNTLRAQDRIIAICKELKASKYINAIGGQSLYRSEDFHNQNIELSFIKMGDVRYRQFTADFIPNLSMVDVMMFNSNSAIHRLLDIYELI